MKLSRIMLPNENIIENKEESVSFSNSQDEDPD